MKTSHEFRDHWRTLAGCTIAAAIGTIGLHAYTSGAFVHELTEIGFTRDQLSRATLMLSASVAVCAPIAGALMDRFGAFRLVAVSIFGEALAFSLLSIIPADYSVYVACIALLAILGVGTTPPGFARMVTARFDRRRGLALGIMISGLGLMAITGPIWATWVIAHLGWRGCYRVMAGLVLVLGGAGLLLIRGDHGGSGQVQVALLGDAAGLPCAGFLQRRVSAAPDQPLARAGLHARRRGAGPVADRRGGADRTPHFGPGAGPFCRAARGCLRLCDFRPELRLADPVQHRPDGGCGLRHRPHDRG
jgi:MFS family permease